MELKRKGIIFDLDGTLLYTLNDLRTAMNQMLSYYKWPLKSPTEILENINFGAREFVRKSLPMQFREDDGIIAKAYEVYSDFYSKCYTGSTFIYPGVKEGVSFLHENGVKLAVFSNKQDIQAKGLVSKLFPEDTFTLVIGNGAGFPHKPSPEGALYIAGQFELDPSDITVVGDSDVDMNLAKNAGMHPVGVSWGYRTPDLLLSIGAEMILTNEDDIKSLI